MRYFKNFFLFLFIFVASLSLFSQQYEPMVVEGNRWRVIKRYATTIPPYLEIYEYHLHGDTTINGKAYKKVYHRELEAVNNDYMEPYKQIGSSYLRLCLREDTVNKVVYCYPITEIISGCPVESEFVLNDFSLQVGDTIPDCDPSALIDTVTDISYQFLSSWIPPNDSIKVFTSESGLLYYERIGSISKGIFHGFWDPYILENFCRGPELNCGIFTTSLMENKNPFHWEVVPNPAHHTCYINLNHSLSVLNDMKLALYDISGKRIENLNGSSSFKLDLTVVTRGLYFLELSHPDWGRDIKKLSVY